MAAAQWQQLPTHGQGASSRSQEELYGVVDPDGALLGAHGGGVSHRLILEFSAQRRESRANGWAKLGKFLFKNVNMSYAGSFQLTLLIFIRV